MAWQSHYFLLVFEILQSLCSLRIGTVILILSATKGKNLNKKIYAMKRYFVYIMTNKSKTLYLGVTSDLIKRVYEHKHKLVFGFTKKYNITRLVYYEETNDVMTAIGREKQIKG